MWADGKRLTYVSICADHVQSSVPTAVANVIETSCTVLFHKLLDILEVTVATRQEELVFFVA